MGAAAARARASRLLPPGDVPPRHAVYQRARRRLWAGVLAAIVHALWMPRVVGLYRGTGTVSSLRRPGGSPFR